MEGWEKARPTHPLPRTICDRYETSSTGVKTDILHLSNRNGETVCVSVFVRVCMRALRIIWWGADATIGKSYRAKLWPLANHPRGKVTIFFFIYIGFEHRFSSWPQGENQHFNTEPYTYPPTVTSERNQSFISANFATSQFKIRNQHHHIICRVHGHCLEKNKTILTENARGWHEQNTAKQLRQQQQQLYGFSPYHECRLAPCAIDWFMIAQVRACLQGSGGGGRGARRAGHS